jgi:hypothetical protein
MYSEKRMRKEELCTIERGGGRRNFVQWKE